ncbi:helicase-exonuclease AddAB subunit AddB [Salisediminibacterium halotolerans]|uniref:ATP-dependent helicase/deoxyribonuclease subunit B n=1 Tax=Salisediminibacterium halotolerans TaxID=517425 RepID=A0A1H9RMJ7_9BACI|nr:helicase-exonuclease AddAB subunit AddB [Salisediminibacterium haloalkalitolerans]SER73946.1 DNA helicase/exodeoxyribonuclease V, subunit B [Salisediminibacterium haloalkalitolerans]
MTVQIHLGRSGTGKTESVYNRIIDECDRYPDGPPIVLIVPEQMTFQAEKELIERSDKGLTRIEVLSFSRLSQRIIKETGGKSFLPLKKNGIHMLLRKITEREKKNFRIFEKASENHGFIEKTEKMITELKRHHISSAAMTETLPNGADQLLIDKLSDLAMIMSQFEQETAELYLDSEDNLQLLAERLPHSEYLHSASVYIDGFHSFTPLEQSVLASLLETVNELVFVLTADRPPALDEELHPLDLFYETKSTFLELKEMIDHLNLPTPAIFEYDEQKRFKTEALAHLERESVRRPAAPAADHTGIRLINAVNRRAEVAWCAREIKRLVRDEGMRYRQFAIFLRNIDDYRHYIETQFESEGLPFFFDQEQSALYHPLVEFIRSSLEIIQQHWRYESVFRALKTEIPTDLDDESVREDIDRLENYVIAYGIRGSSWYSGKRWIYRQFGTTVERDLEAAGAEIEMEEEINRLKDKLTAPFVRFQDRIKNSQTMQDFAASLFQLLEDVDAPLKLARLRERSESEGKPQEARQHDQVWREIVQLLDQVVETADNKPISLQLFTQMIEAGLEGMTFSIIPPAFDQVVVANMETSRLSAVDCTFLMGANEGIIPASPDETSMISEDERTVLEKQGWVLAPGAERQLMNESFLVYLAQTSAKDRLYISYALADQEGRTLQPSMILNHLYEMFPALQAETVFDSSLDVLTEDEELAFVTTKKKTVSHMTAQLQQWKQGYPVSSIWWAAYNYFAVQTPPDVQAETALKSLFYRNVPVSLQAATSKQLYGEQLKTSVSRMEQYYSCPFQQYANYGLKLKERETFKLEAPDIGQLFHAALKEMAESLNAEAIDFKDLTEGEAAVRSKQIVENLAPKIQREIFRSSHRHMYVQKKLEEVVTRASIVLAKQAQKSGFSPAGLEVDFGPGGELPPLTVTLDDGVNVELIGRIDRVDRAEREDGIYVRIIDYKSSAQDLRLDDIYYGLSMQMLLYLDVLLTHGGKWFQTEVTPAGVLYFHVHNPIVTADTKLSADEIEAKMMEQFKMKGLLSSDPAVIEEMDKSLDNGQSSEIVPVTKNKDGKLGKRSRVINDNDYERLRMFLREQVKYAASAITAGDTSLTPFKKKQKVPCTYCSYKSFCQFDPSLEENDYRYLRSKDNDDILTVLENDPKGGNR